MVTEGLSRVAQVVTPCETQLVLLLLDFLPTGSYSSILAPAFDHLKQIRLVGVTSHARLYVRCSTPAPI